MELDLSDVYTQLVAALRICLQCNGAAVLLRSSDTFTIPAQFGTPALAAQVALTPPAHAALGQLTAAQPLLVRAQPTPFAPPLPTPGTGPDWLGLALAHGDQPHGYVCLAGSFDDDDAQRAAALVALAAEALHTNHAGAQQNTRQQIHAYEQRIRKAHDLAGALALVVDASMALTPATHSCIFMNKHGRAVMLARRGYDSEEAALVQQIPPSLEHGLIGRAFQTGRAAVSADIEHDPVAMPALPKTRAQLAIPIGTGQQHLGVIDLQSPTPHAFQALDPELIDALSQLALLALEQPGGRATNGSTTEIVAEHDLLLSSRLAVVTDLAAGVAHEINNPLTTILGYTHLLLRDQDLSPTMRSDISQIMFEGQRIAALVERFLRFAQPSSNGKCPMTIDEPLREALGLLRGRIQESGIVLHVDIPAAAPMVLGQAGQIEQACLELLQNAIEAMSTSDTRQLNVRVSEQSGWVRIAVTDSGRGIRPDLLARVFEPGFTTKVDKGISRGLGLGLYAAHTIAQDHWGRVEVQSQVWQGSTFTLCLPAI